MAWATANGVKVAPDAEGPFSLRAQVALDSAQLAVRDLAGSLAGTSLKGSGRYKWTGRPQLALALEGGKLDARSLLPADLSLFDLFASPQHPYTAGLLASAPSTSRRVERLASLSGSVPPLEAMPGGCRFRPRCPHADERCRSDVVPPLTSAHGRSVRCLRAGDLVLGRPT